MFGNSIEHKGSKEFLDKGINFCKSECHFYKDKEGDCPGTEKYPECRDIAIERVGEPNNWLKRIIRWITA